jgi:hypothetical protein
VKGLAQVVEERWENGDFMTVCKEWTSEQGPARLTTVQGSNLLLQNSSVFRISQAFHPRFYLNVFPVELRWLRFWPSLLSRMCFLAGGITSPLIGARPALIILRSRDSSGAYLAQVDNATALAAVGRPSLADVAMVRLKSGQCERNCLEATEETG